MKWLLWREYRLNRWILVTGSVLIVLSYLIEVLFADNDSWRFFGAWHLICISGYVVVALMAGNAIAGWRANCCCFWSRWRPSVVLLFGLPNKLPCRQKWHT